MVEDRKKKGSRREKGRVLKDSIGKGRQKTDMGWGKVEIIEGRTGER